MCTTYCRLGTGLFAEYEIASWQANTLSMAKGPNDAAEPARLVHGSTIREQRVGSSPIGDRAFFRDCTTARQREAGEFRAQAANAAGVAQVTLGVSAQRLFHRL